MIFLNMHVYSLRRIYNVNQCDIKDVSVFQKKSFCLLPFPRLFGLIKSALYMWHLVTSASCKVISSDKALSCMPVLQSSRPQVCLAPSSICLTPSHSRPHSPTRFS